MTKEPIIEDIGTFIGRFVEEEEKQRRLSLPVIAALRAAGYYKLFKPLSLGGRECDPLTAAKLVEDIARHNTAAAWSMMVANVSFWWCNRLPEQGIADIISTGDDTIIAGAFHPPMAAMMVEGGFRITGRSPLTSMVHEACWIFVSAMVMEAGQPKIQNGLPVILGTFLKAADCEIIDTWFTNGLKATDSNDISVDDIFVPAHLSFPMVPEVKPNSYYGGTLYRFAAIGASVSCLIAPIALGVARNAIEELKELAVRKTSFGSPVALRERGAVQRKVGMAEALVQSSRAFLHQQLTATWNKLLEGGQLTPADKAGLLLAATHANQSCAQAVDLVYSIAGTSAVYNRNKLARHFADIQVIRQHGFANDSRYESCAQVYLGLPTDFPVLHF